MNDKERTPLLSDEAMDNLRRKRFNDDLKHPPGTTTISVESFMDGLHAMRDLYESKITSGELMVVENTTLSILPWHGDDADYAFKCDACANRFGMGENINFCPGCKAKIIA
jgi:hypothetical protein